MTKYYVGSDHCYDGADGSQHHIDVVASALQQAGYEVEKCGVGPNKESVVRQHAGEDAIVVFIACGIDGCTEWSIKEAIRSGNGCKCVFAYTGFAVSDPNRPLHSAETCDNYKIGASWDAGQYLSASSKASCESDINGRTHKEYFEANSEYIAYCYSDISIEDLAQKVVDGNYFGGVGGGTTTAGVGMIAIPDRTFYGLIKQIQGATDSLFITANNMAYLLTFEDIYKYRDAYAEFIPTLDPRQVVPTETERTWSAQGYYNTIEMQYKDGIIKYSNDALVAQYGEQTFHYSYPDDDYETAKAKASALLSAHIRDYATDVYLTCVYNPNITVGSWIKVKKSITDLSPKNVAERVAQLVASPTIEDIGGERIHYYQNRMKNGKQEKVEVFQDEYEMFFVQGYNLKWDKDHALMQNLHLKFAPDSPDDPINATIGGVVSSASAGAGGSYGEDCFGVEIAQLEGDHRIPHSGAGGIEYASSNPPSDEMFMGRCKQGSSYQQEVQGKTPQEVFYLATQKFVYCLYANNCHLYKCNDERWQSGECGFNCGDSATILKSLFDCIGVKNWIFHIHGHYHTMAEINGTIQSVDLSRRVDQYTHSCKFPTAQRGECHCPCHL